MYRQVLALKLSILCEYCTPWPGVPVTTAWRAHRLRMEERPADMEGSCEYIEVVAVSRQVVVLRLGGSAKG